MSEIPDNTPDERDPDEAEDPQAPERLLDRLARKDRAGSVHRGLSPQEKAAIAAAHKQASQQRPAGEAAPNHVNTDTRNKFSWIDRQINEIWAMLRRGRTQQTTGGSLEEVALTLATGTGGTATVAANFTYNFTDSTNASHSNVSPAHQRLNAARKASLGIYSRTSNRLIWTDEIPDAGGCV